MESDLIQYLSSFITENRWELFQKVIEQRTRYITVVLENIFQPHNASAVIRSCDCFGIQDIHVIENSNSYEVNPDVSLGSDKWINLTKYNTNESDNTISAIETLKEKGYRIVATTPHTNDTELEQFNLTDGKIALLFGTELNGLSETAIKHSEEFLKIPMQGFTESFNISVSAAIILHHLTNELKKTNIQWQLTDNEKEKILVTWLKKSIRNGEAIATDFIDKN